MMVVDASVIVSYLVPQDINHQASRQWIRRQVTLNQKIIAPWLLLAEVGGAVSRRTGIPGLSHRAIGRLQKLPNLRLVIIDHQLATEATANAIDYQLRGADSIYVAVAARLNLPLVSWDNEHQERAGVFIKVIKP